MNHRVCSYLFNCIILYYFISMIPLDLSEKSLLLKADALSFSLDSGKKIPCQQDQDINLRAHFPGQPELARCIKCKCNAGYIECERTAPVCPASGQPTAPQQSATAGAANRKSQLALGDKKKKKTTSLEYPAAAQARFPSAAPATHKSSPGSGYAGPKESRDNFGSHHQKHHHIARDKERDRPAISQNPKTTTTAAATATANRQAQVASTLKIVADSSAPFAAERELKTSRMIKTLKSATDAADSLGFGSDASSERAPTHPLGHSHSHVLALAAHVGPRKIGPITFSMLPNGSSPEFSQHQEQVRRLATSSAAAGSVSAPMPADDPRHHEVAIAVFGPSWPSERRRKELVLLQRLTTTTTSSTSPPTTTSDESDDEYTDEDEDADATTPSDQLDTTTSDETHSIVDTETEEPCTTTTTTTPAPATILSSSTTTTTPSTPAEAATTLEPAEDKPTVISIDVIKPSVGETTHNNNASHSNTDTNTNSNSVSVSVSDTTRATSYSDPFSGVGDPNSIADLDSDSDSDPDKLAQRDMEQIANETVFLVALGAELLVVGGIIIMMATFICFEYEYNSEPNAPTDDDDDNNSSKPASKHLASSQHERLSSSCSLISSSGSAGSEALKSPLSLPGEACSTLSATNNTIITIPPQSNNRGLLV